MNTPPKTDSIRSSFEAWISAPPYESDTTRFPIDESESPWHGQYTAISVQIAYEAFLQGSLHSQPDHAIPPHLAVLRAQPHS